MRSTRSESEQRDTKHEAGAVEAHHKCEANLKIVRRAAMRVAIIEVGLRLTFRCFKGIWMEGCALLTVHR